MSRLPEAAQAARWPGRFPQLHAPLASALLVLAGCAGLPSSRPTQPPPAPPSRSEIDRIPDAVPRAEPRSARGNPPFYEVLGRRYFVLPSAQGYHERGVASWYGPGFHAATTSNGERYDMYAMTAAHKTLPLPSYVQVTNLRNGRSVVVRVNDRGPFKEGRIIDLSYTAAAKLDMIEDGTTFVEVRALDASPQAVTTLAANAQAPSAPAGSVDATAPVKPAALYVQAGAFGSQVNATRLLERLRGQGLHQSFVRRDELGGQTLFRVRVGPIPSVGEFDRILAQLKSLGLSDARLATD